jgi:hypothetical protein
MILIAPIQSISDLDGLVVLRQEMLESSIPPSGFTDRHRALRDRPTNLEPTIPMTLLHPILNEFSHDCDTYEANNKDYRFAQDLSAMSLFFSNESERQELFLKICANIGIEFGRRSVPGTNYITNGTIHVKNWPSLIIELKLEAGSAGVESVFQAAAYYGAYMCRNDLQLNFSVHWDVCGW